MARGVRCVTSGCRLRITCLYVRAIAREFRWTLLLLAAAVAWGTALYAITPQEALGGGKPGLLTSLYAGWMALLAQPIYSPPSVWYLLVLDAIYPVLGFLLIGEGIVRFALLMVSRRHGEKEWMRVMASTYRDHIVLCGIGHLGFRVLEQLVSGRVPVVGLEKNADGRFVGAAKDMGIPVLIRDMKEDQALIDAGVPHARTIIIATNDDMANLEVALDARRLNPRIRVIMRLFDQQIAAKIAGALMIDAAFSASALAAPVVAALSLQSKVLPSAVINGIPHVTAELTVAAGSVIAGRSIGEIEQRYSVQVLARTPAGQNLAQSSPARDEVVQAGDGLVIHLAARDVAAITSATSIEAADAVLT